MVGNRGLQDLLVLQMELGTDYHPLKGNIMLAVLRYSTEFPNSLLSTHKKRVEICRATDA